MLEKLRVWIIHALGGLTEREADSRTPYHNTHIYPMHSFSEKKISPIVLETSSVFPERPTNRVDNYFIQCALLKNLEEQLSLHTEFSELYNVGPDTVAMSAKITVLPKGWCAE